MNQINIKDIVNLKIKKNFFKIHGEVLDIAIIDNIRYITIYSFYTRKPEKFIINENMELIKINKKSFINDTDSDINFYKYSNKETKQSKKFFFKIIAFITLSIFIYSIFNNIKYPFFIPKITYSTFLNNNYNLKKLYLTVRKRLDYVYDFDDYWQTPDYAWKNKKGDCEEFASIISDYLNKHQINNYLVGMNTKDNKGHAVVFAAIDNIYYIIDPTRAIEIDGVARLDKIKTLKDAVRIYTDEQAYIYSIPKFNGDKNIIDRVN